VGTFDNVSRCTSRLLRRFVPLLLVGLVAASSVAAWVLTTATGSGSAATVSTTSIPNSITTSPPPEIPTGGGATQGSVGENAISCAQTCVIVGADAGGHGLAVTSSDGGTTWTPAVVPASLGTLEDVTCTGNDCVAVGRGAVIVSTDGGSSWTAHTVPASVTFLAVRCPVQGQCVVVGVEANPFGPLRGVVEVSVDGGMTWSAASIPVNSPALGGIACPTTTRCIAVGETILISDDAGLTWNQATKFVVPGALRSISCSSSGTCIAIGASTLGIGNPNAPANGVISTDSGASWQANSLPAGTSALNYVTCPGASTCYAVGQTPPGSVGSGLLDVSADGGATWTTGSNPPGVSAIAGISCVQPQACVAIGSSGSGPAAAVMSQGSSWAPPSYPVPSSAGTGTGS